ncbi:nudix hydrolase 26, chloroplastic [Malania oleifera]|uniref:nudix hydrolase 26, chloroplastic n=1 Tax=Malania oleifera TaxID=397392 RepID=UPI0025AEA319|nr:nudix hydrolase 26, chloroplastic [Malania oleifera]
MAVSRFASFNFPFSLNTRQLPALSNPTLSFPFQTSRLPKFTNLLLLRRKHLIIPFCAFHSLSMETPPQGYRRNVGICLINPSKKIFAASRLDRPSSWQMPQGGIDEGEDPRDAAIRELREETGVNSAELLAEVPYWLKYDFPPKVREDLNRRWGSDWNGQAQKWFLLKLTGKEDEINLLGDGTEKAEFGEWTWMSPERVIELAVDFKKPVYKEVLKFFSPHLQD